MRRFSLLVFRGCSCVIVAALVASSGCGGRASSDANGGNVNDAGAGDAAFEGGGQGSDASVDAPPDGAAADVLSADRADASLDRDADVYAACPDVDPSPLTDASVTSGRGHEGLRALREEVQASFDAWQAWSAAHDETYEYTRHFQSFTGDFCNTTVVVEGGVVVERRGVDFESGEEWSEVGEDVGKRAACFPASTMEVLYEQCLTEVLCKDPRENDLYVQTDARGLLVQCGYFPHGCSDDCYEGIHALRLRADDSPWNVQRDGCCPIDPSPACCMRYGGDGPDSNACATICDGMPSPGPGWWPSLTSNGCWMWQEPVIPTVCCGCADGGADGAGG